ncbi:MAG: hypothetical protein ACRCZI_01175 [Cetobacterium sp.]
MIVARGLGRGPHGQLLITAGLGLDIATTPPPVGPGHGAVYGDSDIGARRKRRDRDDDVLVLFLL